MKKNRFVMFLPELSYNISGVKKTYAPVVGYNPNKLMEIDEPIPPSASFMILIGLTDWDAPNTYEWM